MTGGSVEVLQVMASWAVTLPAMSAILLWSERRLDPAKRRRAWPAASRDAVLLGAFLVGCLYGSAALFVHFARTRSDWRGFLLGALWAFALVSLNVVALAGVAAAADALWP